MNGLAPSNIPGCEAPLLSMSLPNPPAGPFAALQYRDFRLLWTGQVLSSIGTRMQGAALLWQIYALTHSKFTLDVESKGSQRG